MEFNEKLQRLRRQRGLTQEELAKALFISRTAVSKWESGRGVPNLESLKAISKFFSVSLDELLSGEEILTIAEDDGRRREKHIRDLVFGLLDVSMILYLFLPLFAERGGESVREVSLLSLTGAAMYVRIPYFILVFALIAAGVVTLALQNGGAAFWLKHGYRISLALSAAAAVCFMMTLQPYAALLAFVFLAIKAIMLIKRR